MLGPTPQLQATGSNTTRINLTNNFFADFRLFDFCWHYLRRHFALLISIGNGRRVFEPWFSQPFKRKPILRSNQLRGGHGQIGFRRNREIPSIRQVVIDWTKTTWFNTNGICQSSIANSDELLGSSFLECQRVSEKTSMLAATSQRSMYANYSIKLFARSAPHCFPSK